MSKHARQNTTLHFICSKDDTGRECHFFLRCSGIRPRLLRAALRASAPIDLEHYGAVLASGFGHTPSPQTLEYLQDVLGYDASLFQEWK